MRKISFLFIYLLLFTLTTNIALANQPEKTGFDEFGYNLKARNFVGFGYGWCLARGESSDCLGKYSNDHLKMKWNADWDRGWEEQWTNPPYAAWQDNQWNGAFPGGSGEVYHVKTKWVGDCPDGELGPNGGVCIWGQFETLMEHYTDSNGHNWLIHARPIGYGAN